MGSSNDGSTAAQGAPSGVQTEEDQPPSRGLFGRLMGVFSGADSPSGGKSDDTLTAMPSGGPSVPGLGNLRRLRVDDVAIPKVDIAAVPIDIGRDELVEVFREQGFSRLPVYKGTLDHPQGLVLLKDLALQHGFGSSGRFSLRNLLRPLLFAPPSMPIGVLLQKMQRERVHMALVIDEYGGVDGLVTIEDLIETVIGEIEDEHDEDEGLLWKEEKPGVFLAQSTAPLEEFEALIGFRLRNGEDDQEIDTLGGLVFVRTGRVPVRGEIVPHESGAEFEVVEADPRRIKRLRVRLPGSKPDIVAEAVAPAPKLVEPAAS
ncbi:transporter associated domain-containing protein [Pseudotabrizicola alkalilacus]|uniref:CBS domain-containing protein n=1 Tax=Pseudotabrizicola alkalilacus TaxID=2305252 RepID=A0A411Z5T3_9RHOB|nr:transporter associated domain-containing protein [Pseudotabrizicola alkalilacus]RGP38430.1 CBS domain-containing protein [Pseudotabrizicola alkalilacus]